eukprot:jgi/Mesen1/4385/ME000222S03506
MQYRQDSYSYSQGGSRRAAVPHSYSNDSHRGAYPTDHGPRADDRGGNGRMDDRRYSAHKDREPLRRHNEEEAAPPSRHLWVGNLKANASDEFVAGMFSKFGALESITVYSSRNYAFVNFMNLEHAVEAKHSLQGKNLGLGGTPMRIEYAKGAKQSRHLWVGGIGPSVSTQQLEAEFARFGRVEEFKFLRDRNCAFIDFYEVEDAVRAVQALNGKRFADEVLRVDYGRSMGPKAGSREDRGDGKDSRSSKDPLTSPDSYRRRPSDDGHRRSSADHRSDQLQQGGAEAEGEPSEVLWVGFPLYIKVDEHMLRDAFEPHGRVLRVKCFPGRTYAFVQFERVDDACRAKKLLDQKLFGDQRVHIRFSKSDIGALEDRFGGGGPPDVRGSNGRVSTPPERGMAARLDRGDPHHHRGGDAPLSPGQSRGRGGGFEYSSRSRAGPMQQQQQDMEYHPLPPPQASLPPTYGGGGPRTGGLRREYEDLGEGVGGDDAYMHDPKRPRRMQQQQQQYAPDTLLPPPYDERPPRGYDMPPPIDNRPLFEPPPSYGGPSAQAPPGGGSRLLRPPLDGPPAPQHLPPPVNPGAVVVPSGGAPVGRPPSTPASGGSLWVGSLAKGGTLICRARAFPVNKGSDVVLPDVINCTARTDLDTLAKHIFQAGGTFGVLALIPEADADVPPYEDFVQYLGEKHRAGVAKLADGSTLFLVPPSDFSLQVLKVPRNDTLFGVTLQLQPLPAAATPTAAPPPLQLQQQSSPLLQGQQGAAGGPAAAAAGGPPLAPLPPAAVDQHQHQHQH